MIDFHMHAFPNELASRAMGALSHTASLTPVTDGTLGHALSRMDEWGVEIGVFLHIATKPKNQRAVNDFASSIQSERIFCYGSVHPDAPDAVGELSRIRDLGLYGVKFHPDYQNFFVDDARMYPIYEALSFLGLPVLFHTGIDPLSPHLIHGRPEMIKKIARMFPKLTIIAAHLGGCFCGVGECLAGMDIYIDTAMSCSEEYCSQEQFNRIMKKHDTQRILFGTDLPWSRVTDQMKMIDRANLTGKQREDILKNNALRLLAR